MPFELLADLRNWFVSLKVYGVLRAIYIGLSLNLSTSPLTNNKHATHLWVQSVSFLEAISLLFSSVQLVVRDKN